MPDVPQEAIAAAAVAIERELLSGTVYAMAADSDEALARAAVEAAAPILAEAVARKITAHMDKHDPGPSRITGGPTDHLATWERDLAVIRRDLRYEIAKAAAAGELTPARRTRITEDHVFAVAAASARLMEATARGPYPPAKPHRGGGAA